MSNLTNTFISTTEIMETLEVSESSAYRIIKNLNSELKKKGYLVLPGKVSRKYFNERFYGLDNPEEGGNTDGSIQG